jgi:hypothetical protein
MRCTRMLDHQRASSQAKRISSNDRTVRPVGELESAHRIQANHTNPVGDQRIFPALRRQHSAIGMRDDASAEAAEHSRSEMVIRVVMREHDPFHRLLCHRADGAEEVLGLAWARKRIDDHHARVGHDEAGVRPSLRSSPRVSDECVDAGCQFLDPRMRRSWRRDPRKRHRT